MTSNLTPHFTFEEMTNSRAHPHLVATNRIEAVNYRAQLVEVCEQLELLRAWVARRIYITSGFRGPALNAAIGGVPTSQHCKGEAADFTVEGFDEHIALRCIFNWCGTNLKFGQLIFEQKTSTAPWIHISLGDRGERLVFENGVYTRL